MIEEILPLQFILISFWLLSGDRYDELIGKLSAGTNTPLSLAQ